MAVIATSKGNLDETTLKKQIGTSQGDTDTASHTEYWLGGNPACTHTHDFDDPTRMCEKGCGAKLVQRSATTKLKKGTAAASAVASFK